MDIMISYFIVSDRGFYTQDILKRLLIQNSFVH